MSVLTINSALKSFRSHVALKMHFLPSLSPRNANTISLLHHQRFACHWKGRHHRRRRKNSSLLQGLIPARSLCVLPQNNSSVTITTFLRCGCGSEQHFFTPLSSTKEEIGATTINRLSFSSSRQRVVLTIVNAANTQNGEYYSMFNS